MLRRSIKRNPFPASRGRRRSERIRLLQTQDAGGAKGKQEHVRAKRLLELDHLGYTSGEDSNKKDFTRDCMLVTHPDPPAEDGTARATSEGEQDDLMAIDPSTENNAARIWPPCQQPCEICEATHVAIPGSFESKTCVRISLCVRNRPSSVAEQSQRQSILIPTDKYELSVLGWLIWSTFAHQVTLRDARTGAPPHRQRSRDYICTEIGRFRKDGMIMVLRPQHSRKTAFEKWWEGKKNLRVCRGQRWMVITFPWEMGDVNLADASFGAMGRLFSLPNPEPRETTASGVAISAGAKPTSKNKMKSLEPTENREHDECTDSVRDISGGDRRKKRKKILQVDKGKYNVLAVSVPARFIGPYSRANPAFHTCMRTHRRALKGTTMTNPRG